MKKYLYFLFMIFRFAKLEAQIDDNLYNPNLAYLKDVEGVEVIKVIQTDNKSDYRAENIHYFNNKNQNYKTISKYKDTLQGRYYFKFNKNGQLIREDNYSLWVNEKLDTSKVICTIDYRYLPNGLVKSVNNTWYDEKNAILRIQLFYKYDNRSNLIVEERLDYNLDSSTEKIYFKPNSNSSAENQNPPNFNRDLVKYKYTKQKTVIENYRKNELRSKIVKTISKNIEISHLINTKGDTLRTITIFKDEKGRNVKIQVTGDENISDFCEYGDGGGNDLIIYEYNKLGLIESITYQNSKNDLKHYTKFEYINRSKSSKYRGG